MRKRRKTEQKNYSKAYPEIEVIYGGVTTTEFYGRHCKMFEYRAWVKTPPNDYVGRHRKPEPEAL